jgi:hypothetical protein
MADGTEWTDVDKLKSVEREIAMRKNAYPKWVASGRMKQETAAREIAIMEAIANDYRRGDFVMKHLKAIIAMNRNFRDSLPRDWEGDPLDDACNAAISELHLEEFQDERAKGQDPQDRRAARHARATGP